MSSASAGPPHSIAKNTKNFSLLIYVQQIVNTERKGSSAGLMSCGIVILFLNVHTLSLSGNSVSITEH